MIRQIAPGAVLFSHGETEALQELKKETLQLLPDVPQYIPEFLERIIIQKSNNRVSDISTLNVIMDMG